MATSQSSQRQLRGSQKMLEHLSRNGDAPSIDEIKKAVALPSSVDYKVLNWLIRGIPPAYLELDATLQISTAHLGDLVNQFVKLNDSAIGLEILINGIPFPEIANVRIRNIAGPGE
jgi:hypothetical protein